MQDKLTVRTEPAFPVATVQLRGALDLDTAPLVRNALRKHIADQPAALIVELSELVVLDRAALSVLRSAVRAAGEVPGIPLILLVPDEELRIQLRGIGLDRQAPIVADRETAVGLASSMEAPLCRVVRDLPSALTSLRVVREITRESCSTWRLDAVSDAVVLVVSEFVTNVIEHARTTFDLTIALRGRYLHVAVRDGNVEPPRRRGSKGHADQSGRGLLLVDELSAAWGHVPISGGKLVWATVPVG